MKLFCTDAFLHILLSDHAGPRTRRMDVSKELRMFLMLALLFLGPGKQTTALPELQDVKCIVFSDDYMICDWESSQKPVSNYSLYYWYAKNRAVECAHYLQRDGVNTGCWFNKSQIDYDLSFNVYLNASNNINPIKRYSSLFNQVKPSPPVNLTLQSLGNNQLLLTWGTTYGLQGCLQHMVTYWSSTDTNPKDSSTEEMMYILPSVDPKKLYTFYVKSKINERCATAEHWSLTAGPVFWGRNSTGKGTEDKAKSMSLWIQRVLFLIGSLLLLIMLVLILMRMERVWLVLMPRIPNAHNKFEELFTAYQGNFSEWAGVPKDAVESFKPSYHESICHVTELLPGGGYLPLGNDVLGKAGEAPGISVDPVSKINIE